MKLSLLVLSQGRATGKALPITLAQFLIGRDPQCHLRPASPLISKRHCAILVKGGKVFLRDFGSTNGSFVNDEPVKAERQLRHDDVLKIGPLLFRVQIEAGAPAPVDKPTPPPPQVKQAKAPEPAGDDESIAAILLSLQDEDGAATVGDAPALEEEIPSGTTVMDVPAMPPEKPDAQDKKAPPPAKDKSNVGNSSSAAAALLQKYSRRPRTS